MAKSSSARWRYCVIGPHGNQYSCHRDERTAVSKAKRLSSRAEGLTYSVDLKKVTASGWTFDSKGRVFSTKDR